VILGRIIGEVHGTIKHSFYEGKKLLIVEKISHEGVATGDYLIAADTVGAGAGEQVLVLDEGNGARQILQSADGPVRSVIVGVIDDLYC
jgi:microcompartment protein CcmK/EutM